MFKNNKTAIHHNKVTAWKWSKNARSYSYLMEKNVRGNFHLLRNILCTLLTKVTHSVPMKTL